MKMRARILVVEDEPDIRRFMGMTLKSGGHEAYEITTLRRGWIEPVSLRTELAIIDLGLPCGKGADLICNLRAWSTVQAI